MMPPSANPADALAPFPIVAVGASAGGLAPTQEVLRGLGAQPGVAVVVIHHLDPTQQSELVEILSRATPLPVAVAADGVRAEADHVYVLPPNAGLLIDGGVLRIVSRPADASPHRPIDRFFESLALDQDGLAMGVILSGSGFDGTEGIKAIKRAGGVTLAQDDSAAHDGMPRSAIATGCVDLILPPAELARAIVRMAANAPDLIARARAGVDEAIYLRILAIVRRSSGVDFTSYKRSTIHRRLRRRLVFLGIPDLAAYAERLERDPVEASALCEEVLIHVTSFFREPEALEALSAHVFPVICDRPSHAPLRIWVPGCSTGEEVYSIAICLLEYIEERKLELTLKIFGTDLSEAVIEKARSGRYPASIEGQVSPARLARFFTREDGAYRISRSVRDLCVFAKHDVARDPPFSAMALVSCRNVMIYLGAELQERVIGLLHYALDGAGFLVLGSSETVRAFVGFTALDGKNKIYAKTSAVPRRHFDFTERRTFEPLLDPGPPVGPSDRLSRPPDVQREADRLVLAAFGPPGVVVADDLTIVQFRGRTSAFLEHASGVASLDLLRTAREDLRLPLRRAIERARASGGPVKESGVAMLVDGARRTVTVEIIPFGAFKALKRHFLILFEDTTDQPEAPAAAPVDEAQPNAGLERELVSTRQYLESVIEQLEAANQDLKAANEEVVSSNEELRSTNEELQSAKEELQATNEELLTVNDEMRERSLEAKRLSDDLANVLTSVDIPIVIVGRERQVRRFTPAAARLFRLDAGSIGHDLAAIPQLASVAPTLVRLVPEVLQRLQPVESTIQAADERWHQLSLRPYLTTDGRIDGVVMAARDVDTELRSLERLSAARAYAQRVIDTVREGLVVVDSDLRVTSANKAFLENFRLSAPGVEGHRLDELDRPALADPLIAARVRAPERGSARLRIEYDDGAGGRRAALLDTRTIEGTELVLLALEDVTAAEHAQAAADRAELRFRDVLASAPAGILIVAPSGRILFANPAASALFGYSPDELVALTVEALLPEALREQHVGHRGRFAARQAVAMASGRDIAGRRKDGSEVAVQVVLSPMATEDGPVVVAFITDVREQREAHGRIKAYQERLQKMAFDDVLTEERERRRIAVQLHDRIGQSLALAQIKLTSIRDALQGDTRAAVDAGVGLLEDAIGDTRTLVFELSPPILYDLGLEQALAWLADDVERRLGIKIELSDDGTDKPLDDAAKAVVFRAVRELVMNVFKHARVHTAKLSLRRADDHVLIDVEDQGVGFVPEEPPRGGGFGILSVREQITRLGGTLNIASSQRGTLASMSVPLAVGDAPVTS